MQLTHITLINGVTGKFLTGLTHARFGAVLYNFTKWLKQNLDRDLIWKRKDLAIKWYIINYRYNFKIKSYKLLDEFFEIFKQNSSKNL